MTKPTKSCGVTGCTRPFYGAGYCRRHHRQHWRYGTVPVLDVSLRKCEQCKLPLDHKNPEIKDIAIYCSIECKHEARSLEKIYENQQKKLHRTCLHCKRPMDESRSGKAKFCSLDCNTTFHNKRKADEKYAVKVAARQPCRGCGGVIPESCRSNAVYCSRDCKERNDHKLLNSRTTNLAWRRRTYYNLLPGEFEALLASQDGKCAICRLDTWPGKYNKPHVDHDHETNRVRGILCHSCNVALGNFHDRIDLLEAAIAYLRR